MWSAVTETSLKLGRDKVSYAAITCSKYEVDLFRARDCRDDQVDPLESVPKALVAVIINRMNLKTVCRVLRSRLDMC